MGEFLRRLQALRQNASRFVGGGRHGERLEPAVAGQQPGFVRDTAMHALGTQDTRITGVPNLQNRLAGLVFDLGGQASPRSNSVFVHPEVGGQGAEQIAGHELAHVFESNIADDGFLNQMAEMRKLLVERQRALPEEHTSQRRDFQGDHVMDRGEHLATAFENAFAVLRGSEPGNHAHLVAQIDREVPGTALAYNYIQRQLAKRGQQAEPGQFPVSLPEFARMLDTSNEAIRGFQAARDSR